MPVTASSIVGAVIALARINADGEWVEPCEHVSVHDLFERMSRQELQIYAETGKLPDWFPTEAAVNALTAGEQ